MGVAGAALSVEQDHGAVAAQAIFQICDGLLGDNKGRICLGDPVAGPLAQDQFHDGLAPSGAGDGGAEVIGVASATDQGGIADSSRSLVQSTAGGGGSGKIPIRIQSDRSDGVMRCRGRFPGKGQIGLASGSLRPELAQAVTLARNY